MQKYKTRLIQPIDTGIVEIIETKTALKTNTRDKKDSGYKELLKKLNSDLAKERRIKNKLGKELESPEDIACKIVEATLDVLEHIGCKTDLIPLVGHNATTYVKRIIK